LGLIIILIIFIVLSVGAMFGLLCGAV